ncbi:MAG: helix-turn-helix domain-containing protein [Flavobacteriales bacterium]|nr:helix-turn-helix domain-containing protein [Flavobacteriales bacterium]
MKIGLTDDLKSRRSILNVGNHKYLRLWLVVEAVDAAQAALIERVAHSQFEASHIRGEWFDLSERDLPTIKRALELAELADFELGDWSLERKSCQEFTPLVCKRARQALGLTVAELAEKADLSLTTVNSFEDSSRCPHLETIEALRCALELEGVEFVPQQPGKPFKVLI